MELRPGAETGGLRVMSSDASRYGQIGLPFPCMSLVHQLNTLYVEVGTTTVARGARLLYWWNTTFPGRSLALLKPGFLDHVREPGLVFLVGTY